MKNTIRRLLRDRRGSIAILVAFGIVALAGFAGLAVDVSSFYFLQGGLQTTADVAAWAAISIVLMPKIARKKVCAGLLLACALLVITRTAFSGFPPGVNVPVSSFQFPVVTSAFARTWPCSVEDMFFSTYSKARARTSVSSGSFVTAAKAATSAVV